MELCFATQSLCKSYRHSQVLRGLTMQVPQGAIYGLVGQNGAGKTTLIRLISGQSRPCSGRRRGAIPSTAFPTRIRPSSGPAAGWEPWWSPRPSTWT